MGSGLRLPTGLLSHLVFLQGAVTIRNVENGRTAQAEGDIVLNLPPDVPVPAGNWKGVVWEPEKMYVAKWEDKLTGKIKYVWFSDTAFLKQNREKEKFQKAENFGQTNQNYRAAYSEEFGFQR